MFGERDCAHTKENQPTLVLCGTGASLFRKLDVKSSLPHRIGARICYGCTQGTHMTVHCCTQASSLSSPHVPDRNRRLRAELALEAIAKVAEANEAHRRQGTNCKDETSGGKVLAS